MLTFSYRVSYLLFMCSAAADGLPGQIFALGLSLGGFIGSHSDFHCANIHVPHIHNM
jgi:hypothetical protein